MGFWKDLFKMDIDGWIKINKIPKWIKFPNPDKNNFIFYAKGKNYKYKIEVKNYKLGNQKEKVWRKARKK